MWKFEFWVINDTQMIGWFDAQEFLGAVHWDRSQKSFGAREFYFWDLCTGTGPKTCRDVFDFLNRSSSVVDIVDRRSTYSDSHDRWRFLHPRSSINISTFTMMDNSKIEYSRSVTILTSSIIGRRHRRSTFRQSQGWMMDDGWWKTDRPRSEIWMSSTSSIDSHNDEWWITVKLSMTIDDDRRFECRRHRRSTHRQSQWWMMDNSNIEYVDRPRSEIECRRHRRSTMIDCDDYDDYDDYDDWIIDNKKYKYPFN